MQNVLKSSKDLKRIKLKFRRGTQQNYGSPQNNRNLKNPMPNLKKNKKWFPEHHDREDENPNPKQLESLNSELQRFCYEFFRKQQRAGISNPQKYFIFCIKVGKAWHFILKT
jgi:hypothetical protein